MGVWVSFCVERGAGQYSPAGPRPQGGAAARCPGLCFPSIPCPARAARIDGVTEGTWEPVTRPGESALEPFCLSGKRELVRSPFSSSSWRGPEVGASDPSSASAHPPPCFGLLPLSPSRDRGRPAPRLLFRVPISPQPALYPSLRCKRVSPGTGPGSPFKLDPARVPAPILGLAGATR